MKNLLALFLVIALCFVFVGCSADTTSVDEPENVQEQETDNATLGEKNALKTADNYLATMSFSKSGLVKQLEYEGYTNSEATYAVENCGADWNEQAANMAHTYLDTMAFSRDGLIEQLKYEGFTDDQAAYGAKAVGY